MVCLGNICRSPTAHAVLEKMLENKNLSRAIKVDSAGTSRHHIGERPDSRSIAAAAQRGYEMEDQLARQVCISDFHDFDYILAMDQDNLLHLKQLQPEHSKARVQLLLAYSNEADRSVPDPYFGDGERGFEKVLDIVEDACLGLLGLLEQDLKQFNEPE